MNRLFIAISEPGAVATGHRVNFKTTIFEPKLENESAWPVATALGSDVEYFLCKAEPQVTLPDESVKMSGHFQTINSKVRIICDD